MMFKCVDETLKRHTDPESNSHPYWKRPFLASRTYAAMSARLALLLPSIWRSTTSVAAFSFSLQKASGKLTRELLQGDSMCVAVEDHVQGSAPGAGRHTPPRRGGGRGRGT